MEIKKISKAKYLELWDSLKHSVRGTSNELSRHPFESEEDWRLRINEHFNPSKPPLHIDYFSEEGITRFVPEGQST